MIEDNSRLNVYPYHKTFPIRKTGLLSVDTGCFSTGNLTAVVTENKEMTFVKVQNCDLEEDKSNESSVT
jgi:hypothetical protein